MSIYMKIVQVLALPFSALREGGAGSPFSMRRVALAAMIPLSFILALEGFKAYYAAVDKGAVPLMGAVAFLPFTITAAIIVSIILGITKTDISEIIGAVKGERP